MDYEKGMTRTSNLAQVNRFYVKNLLENGKMWLVHDYCAQKVDMPKGQSKFAVFKRYAAFALARAPLTEARTPDGQSMSSVEVSALLLQWGDWTAVSDVVSWTSEDPQITIATDLLADQYGESLDTYFRDQLVGGASVRYANGVAGTSSVITALSDGDVRSARATLLRAKGKFFNPNIKAGTGVGSSPIGVSYWAITHTDNLGDLEQLTGFVPVHKYPNPGVAAEFEAGYAHNVRFLMTQNAYVKADQGASVSTSGLRTSGGSNVDVYCTTVFAKNAYGIVRLGPKNMEVIVEALGSGGTSDPLHQRGTVAWKCFCVLKILKEDWMIRIEHGVRA